MQLCHILIFYPSHKEILINKDKSRAAGRYIQCQSAVWKKKTLKTSATCISPPILVYHQPYFVKLATAEASSTFPLPTQKTNWVLLGVLSQLYKSTKKTNNKGFAWQKMDIRVPPSPCFQKHVLLGVEFSFFFHIRLYWKCR